MHFLRQERATPTTTVHEFEQCGLGDPSGLQPIYFRILITEMAGQSGKDGLINRAAEDPAPGPAIDFDQCGPQSPVVFYPRYLETFHDQHDEGSGCSRIGQTP
jgi:hypothetical protein